jgi:hypothetical protein
MRDSLSAGGFLYWHDNLLDGKKFKVMDIMRRLGYGSRWGK